MCNISLDVTRGTSAKQKTIATPSGRPRSSRGRRGPLIRWEFSRDGSSPAARTKCLPAENIAK
jgi:hypothetical protein